MTTPRRGRLSHAIGISLVAAATTWAATISWSGFVEDRAPYLLPLFFLGAVVAVSGGLCRWWRLPGYVVVAVQLVFSSAAMAMVTTGAFPIGAGWNSLIVDFTSAISAARAYASPVPGDVPGAGVYPLLIGGGLALLLLVDLLACTLRRVPLAGVPLLAVYSLPLSMLGGGVSWWVFAFTAAGFLTLLYLHEHEQIAQWGRPLLASGDLSTLSRRDPAPGSHARTGVARASALVIGGTATALALVVPLAIPTLSLGVFDFGVGEGGNKSISVENPIADLRRDLRRDKDIALLRVRTTDPRPEYLRISVLNRFRDNEWSSGDRQVPADNRPVGPMPELEGVSTSLERTTYPYDVTVDEQFDSTWLPTQAPISEIRAAGDWRFDLRTRDFIAGDGDLDTGGMTYSMTAVKLVLKGDALAEARTSTVAVSEEYTELPGSVPALIRDLALDVTAEPDNRFDKAVALQNWFRSEFVYSLEAAEEANGVDALERFLSPEGRVGYCEQFAASMAVMARSLNIPARVAVGFLRPDRVGLNTWEYSAHDLHAWPELYFDGFGWVRFEPTPSIRASGVPRWTRDRDAVSAPNQPDNRPEAEVPPQSGRERPDAAPDPVETDEKTAEQGGIAWVRIALGVGGGLALIALFFAPARIRRGQRDRRVSAGVEGAWAELEATSYDLGVLWPQSRSPRETRDVVVRYFGGPVDDVAAELPARGPSMAPDAVVAIDRLVDELEWERYSRSGIGRRGSLSSEVATCSEALRNGATPRVRRRARWLPRSVLRRTQTPESSAPSEAPEEPFAVGSGVERMH